MSTILRRAPALGRLASYSLSSPARSGLRAPSRVLRAGPSAAWATQRPRFYADDKPSSEPSDNKVPKKQNGKGQGDISDTSSPRPAQGKPGASEDWEADRFPLPPNWVYLSKTEYETMMRLTEQLDPGKLGKLGADFSFVRRTGVPRTMVGVLKRYEAGGDCTWRDTAKLLMDYNRLSARHVELVSKGLLEPAIPVFRDKMGVMSARKQAAESQTRSVDDNSKKGSKEESQHSAEENMFTPNSAKKSGGQESPKPPNPDGPGRPNDWMSTIIATIVAYWVYDMIFGEDNREITWQDFRKNFLDKGLVEKLVVSSDNVYVYLNREATQSLYPDSPAVKPGFRYYFSIGSREGFERRLEDAQQSLGIPPAEMIPVSYLTPGFLSQAFLAFAPTLLLIGLLGWLSRRGPGGGGAGGVFGMGKSRAKRFNHETSVKIKFSDVAGMDEAKQEIMEFVSFLQKPEKFVRLGAKIPRGAILAGPPGTGKTMLAKATAGESGVPFFSVSGSEFVEMFVGVGASRVRDLFATARKNTPCIIFIDEIDAIGKARAEGKNIGGGHDEREATLNQILTEMDGFNTSEQVVVLAGTNRVDILDKALMRPGRFDRHINIDRPTMKGRQDIFKVYLPKIVTKEDTEYLSGRLAALTPGFAGADIANCVNEAALIAARTNATSVTMQHFEQAIERVIGGLERKSLVLNPTEKRTVAYHEAGHAICGWYFQYADPLLKVSIIPRGQGALGYAQYLPGDAYLMTYQQLMDRMAMTLGGRISEEIHFPTVTTGASDDFQKVTRMATAMVTEWGMSDKVGTINFRKDENSFQKPFSETTGQVIDEEIKRIVAEAYKQCKDLLVAKKKEVGMIAEELLKKEVLVRDDMVRLLGPRPFDDREEFNKYFGGNAGKGPKSAPPPPPSESTGEPPIDGPAPTMSKKTDGKDLR